MIRHIRHQLRVRPVPRSECAIRRTNELNRLRELLDTQGTADFALAAPTIALLANRSDSDPEANNYETDWNLQSPAPAPFSLGRSGGRYSRRKTGGWYSGRKASHRY